MFVPWLEGRTAWELFSLLHVLLALVALTAVALPLIKATAPDSPLRVSIGTVLSRAGLVALTITATFLIEGADRNVGIFLAVLAAAGILCGGMTTPDEAAEGTRGRRRERERPRRAYSSEEFEEPPPGMEDWRPGARSWGPEEFEEEPASTRAGGRSSERREPGGVLAAGAPPARPPLLLPAPSGALLALVLRVLGGAENDRRADRARHEQDRDGDHHALAAAPAREAVELDAERGDDHRPRRERDPEDVVERHGA